MSDPEKTTPTPPPSAPVPDSGSERSALEKAEDAFADHRANSGAARGVGDVAMGGNFTAKMERIVADLDEEAAADKKMLATIGTALHDHGPLEAQGLDLAAVKALDASFDEEAFMTVARETFYKVREAESLESPQLSDALLSPQMQSDLGNRISGEVASHRHHLLPLLEIATATITGAGVADNHEHLVVRFHLTGEELDRDDATGAVVAGSTTMHEWDEDWQFERDPAVDTSQSDEQHILGFSGWMVAHRGWVVTAISRAEAAAPS